MASAFPLVNAGGRIGRIRFLYISFLIFLLFSISRGFGPLLGLLGAVVCLVGYALLTIKRVHDFNQSGWLALLLGLPLINIALWFIPGTDGENEYGAPTEKNKIGEVALAILLPLLITGALLYFAVPAYQQYVERARANAGAYR